MVVTCKIDPPEEYINNVHVLVFIVYTVYMLCLVPQNLRTPMKGDFGNSKGESILQDNTFKQKYQTTCTVFN